MPPAIAHDHRSDRFRSPARRAAGIRPDAAQDAIWRARCTGDLARGEEEHMRGTITRKEVLIHSLTIVRLFGARAYWRCLCAAFSPAPSTFLEVVLRQEG
jgi:hypothetical protein